MSLSKHAYILPSVLLSEAYYQTRDEPAALLDKAARIIDMGYFKSVEFPYFERPKDRAALKKLMKGLERGVLWLGEDTGASLSADAKARRAGAVERAGRVLEFAAEAGFTHAALRAGPAVGLTERSAALKALFHSLAELNEHARRLSLTLLVDPAAEPGRRGILSSIYDVKDAFDLLAPQAPGLALVLDTACCALHGERPADAVVLVKDYLAMIRLSNAVVSFRHPAYGRSHTLPGAPGFLTALEARDILSRAFSCSAGGDAGLLTAACIRQNESGPGDRTAQLSGDFIRQAEFEFLLAG